MELLQNGLQLLRDRQAEVRGVFHEADAFIGNVEENNCRAQDTAGADHLRVESVPDAHQQEDQNLAADTLKADLAGELLVTESTHHTGDIVYGHKGQKGIQQAVVAAE